MKKMFTIVILIISIFCLYGCGEKKIYSEEDKIKFAEEMVNYDKIDEYDRLSVRLVTSKKKEKMEYFYNVNLTDTGSIYRDNISLYLSRGIYVNEVLKQKTEYELEKNNKTHITSLITDEYDGEDLINSTKAEMTEKEFLDEYLCKTVENFNVDLLQATKYYRVFYKIGLHHATWENYFLFDKYEYHFKLFEYNWDMLITKIYIQLDDIDNFSDGITDYSFSRIIIDAVDKNDKDMKYEIDWFIRKQ